MGLIKLQSHSVEEEFQLRAGFWGYLMQITYQVGLKYEEAQVLFYEIYLYSCLKDIYFPLFLLLSLDIGILTKSWFELMFCIEQVSAGAVALTDIVFWCVIAPFMTISHLSYLNTVSIKATTFFSYFVSL